jgi:hypothetical protein
MATLEKNVSTINTSVYKVAALTASGMILFFLLMKLIGLVTVVELRFFNFFIMFIGVRYKLLEARRSNNGKLEYLQGMLTGFLTSLFTAIFFAVFLFIYLSIDSQFMNYIKVTQPFGTYISAASAALITVIEGVAGGAIITFALTHILNRDGDQG